MQPTKTHFLANVVLLWHQFTAVECGTACVNDEECDVGTPFLRWFTLGDWGGLPVWPYRTYAESTVAETLGQMGADRATDFQLALGDNFYLLGVKDEWDRRFQRTFENVYTATSLQTPWFVLAGNHDHYGNVSGQIAYSQHSARWTFPSLNYTIHYRLSDGTRVDIVMIDTVELCGNTRTSRLASLMDSVRDEGAAPSGPADEAKAEAQWAWIETTLAASTADFLFVAGHFPVWSTGTHGPTRILVDRLRPLLFRHRVSAYLSGHDHILQHLQETKDGARVHFVISGAGGFLGDADAHAEDVPSGLSRYFYPEADVSFLAHLGLSRGAFVYSQLNRTAAEFVFFRGDGEELYHFHTGPRPPPSQ